MARSLSGKAREKAKAAAKAKADANKEYIMKPINNLDTNIPEAPSKADVKIKSEKPVKSNEKNEEVSVNNEINKSPEIALEIVNNPRLKDTKKNKDITETQPEQNEVSSIPKGHYSSVSEDHPVVSESNVPGQESKIEWETKLTTLYKKLLKKVEIIKKEKTPTTDGETLTIIVAESCLNTIELLKNKKCVPVKINTTDLVKIYMKEYISLKKEERDSLEEKARIYSSNHKMVKLGTRTTKELKNKYDELQINERRKGNKALAFFISQDFHKFGTFEETKNALKKINL